MKILAIDTSNQPLSVAVLEDGNLLSQATCTKTKNHSVKLLPLIERLMEDARLKPCELDRIVVAKGPGSYTGLRIGVATAKTLAYTLDKELAGVSSLEVLAAAFPKTEKSVLVPLFDARRGNVFAGAYRYDEKGLLQTVMSDRHIAVADLCEEFASQNVIFVGRDAQAYSDLINEKCKKGTISSFGLNGLRNIRRGKMSMTPMLKKFKTGFNRLFGSKNDGQLEFKCRNVKVKGYEYLFVRAVVPDIPEILDIERAVYKGQTPWNFENFEAQIREQERTLYLVVRHNDEMVGFAGCDMKYATYEAHITNIAVLPPYQNLGLGQMLIKTLIDKADKRGLRKVSLEVRQSNVNAHEAYRFAGFVDRIVKKDYYTDSPAEDAIEMVYSINANKRKERMTNG